MRPEEIARLVEEKLDALSGNPTEESINATLNLIKILPPTARVAVEGELVRRCTRINEARAELKALRQKYDRLTQPPLRYGTLTELIDGNNGAPYAAVTTSGGYMLELSVSAEVDTTQLKIGDQVVICEDGASVMSVIGVRRPPQTGDIGEISEVLGDGRLLLEEVGGSTRVLRRANTLDSSEIQEGDRIRYDRSSGIAFELFPKSNQSIRADSYSPASFTDVGGLDKQIQQIREAVFWPLRYTQKYEAYGLTMPKGVMLSGPPGCGKTLLARATITELIAFMTGSRSVKRSQIQDHFLYVKGPELLSMWVGETEKGVRDIFMRARKTAQNSGLPVLVFWDEIESMIPIRGSRVSSSVDATIVPTFLSEMDGLDNANGQIVLMGATNRADVVDPALLRPGRFDLLVDVPRPDREAAGQILRLYLHPGLPYAGEAKARVTAEELADIALGLIFSRSEDIAQLVTLIFRDGSRKPVFRSELFSGALARSIVHRSALRALRREIAVDEMESDLLDALTDPGGSGDSNDVSLVFDENGRGIRKADVIESVVEEFKGLTGVLTPGNVHSYLPIPDGQDVIAVQPLSDGDPLSYRRLLH